MVEADAPPEKKTVNVRMSETFLEDIDATWSDEGFNSRSEFIRHVVRDALKHPEFNRADLKAMLAGEVEIQDGRTHGSDAVRDEFDLGPSVSGDDE